jgi:hypothetical protein
MLCGIGTDQFVRLIGIFESLSKASAAVLELFEKESRYDGYTPAVIDLVTEQRIYPIHIDDNGAIIPAEQKEYVKISFMDVNFLTV